MCEAYIGGTTCILKTVAFSFLLSSPPPKLTIDNSTTRACSVPSCSHTAPSHRPRPSLAASAPPYLPPVRSTTDTRYGTHISRCHHHQSPGVNITIYDTLSAPSATRPEYAMDIQRRTIPWCAQRSLFFRHQRRKGPRRPSRGLALATIAMASVLTPSTTVPTPAGMRLCRVQL